MKGVVTAEVPTSLVPFKETEHGRLRRKQRGIDKKDLQRALKYGKREGAGRNRGKYTYNGIVYIVNEETFEEITSYAIPLTLDPIIITLKMDKKFDEDCKRIWSDISCWTSNTVLVVDVSGSMKASDVWGTRNRLGAVWVSVALDFLAHRLETGAAGPTDVISVVTLGEEPTILVEYLPSSWILYNEILKIYTNKRIVPRGHGLFLPALEVATDLLTLSNCKNSDSCAKALLFLSDGRPSDSTFHRGMPSEHWTDEIVRKTGDLARQFGRTLNFTAIGVGDVDDFHVLKRMVDAAKDFGAVANFQLPSMTSSSIGQVFTQLSSALTTTQTELTALDSKTQQQVKYTFRESRRMANVAINIVTASEFDLYGYRSVQRIVYKEWFDENRKRQYSYHSKKLRDPNARGVALAKQPFGEGSERFAYRFFEVAADLETVVGRPMVAKESRFIVNEDIFDEIERRKFIRQFCTTQQLARRLAKQFNRKMKEIPRIDSSTPTVSFLDCSIYKLRHPIHGIVSVLVEDKLDHGKWHKWNTNNGYVEGMKKAPDFSDFEISARMMKITLDRLTEITEEGESETEEESDDGDRGNGRICFSPSEVAQAFSHFTYNASGKKRLVCDLQGVFDEDSNELKFSDPAIHYYDVRREGRHGVHGQTDKGKKGIAMFFETHKCNDLCTLILRGFKDARCPQPSRNKNT